MSTNYSTNTVGSHTGIDENTLACDISRLLTGEEAYDIGYIFWLLTSISRHHHKRDEKQSHSYLWSFQSGSRLYRLFECLFWRHTCSLGNTRSDLFPHLLTRSVCTMLQHHLNTYMSIYRTWTVRFQGTKS